MAGRPFQAQVTGRPATPRMGEALAVDQQDVGKASEAGRGRRGWQSGSRKDGGQGMVGESGGPGER